MNWEHIALWIPAIICVVTAIYTAGVGAQVIKSHEVRLNKHSEMHEKHVERHDKHSEKLAEHSVTLEGHNIKLGTLTAWHQGFNAGTHRG